VSAYIKLLRISCLAPTFSIRTRPESRRLHFVSATAPFRFWLGTRTHRADWASSVKKILEHYDAVFRVASCCIFGLPSSRMCSNLLSPTPCTSCHLSVQTVRGALKSAGVGIMACGMTRGPLYLLTTHLARCGGDVSIHTAHSWSLTPLAEIISKVRGALRVGVDILTDAPHDVGLTPQRQRRPLRGCGRFALQPWHPRLATCYGCLGFQFDRYYKPSVSRRRSTPC
jgi:hypothetical protein